MGFKLGMPKFISGEKDWVYGVIVNGKNVSAGDKISVEDSVYIQVGNGLRDLSDSVNYIDPIYIDENDLMKADEFEEVESSSSTERREYVGERKSESEVKSESKKEKKPETTESKP